MNYIMYVLIAWGVYSGVSLLDEGRGDKLNVVEEVVIAAVWPIIAGVGIIVALDYYEDKASPEQGNEK